MQKLIRISAVLIILGGLTSFSYLILLPGEGGILGLSPFRLISLIVILLGSVFSAFVFARFGSTSTVEKFDQWILKAPITIPASFLFITVALTFWLAILYKEAWLQYFSEAFYIRLVPVLAFGALFSLLTGYVFLYPHLDRTLLRIPSRPILKTTAMIAGSFALIGIFISTTKIGFTFDSVGLNWGPPGTPLTFPQVNLVFAIGVLFSLAIHILIVKVKSGHLRWLTFLDTFIIIALWTAAVLLWSNETMGPSHFAPSVSEPNNEYYPYSDAAIFDRASYRLVTGIGFSEDLVRRPLYVGLLALFHTLGGVSYDGTVAVQILFLAFIPPLLYLLTSQLSNRLAGFLLGGLVILRETNAIALSGSIVTSHAKLLMSDLPTMLGIAALILACIVLFKKPIHDRWLLLSIGGILGLIALIRAQSLVLLPLVILLVLASNRFKKTSLLNAGFVLAGLFLVILPWAGRNWIVTGNFALGDSGEKILLARNYSFQTSEYPGRLPEETSEEYSDRLTGQILSFIIEHPGNVAFFVSNHFLRGLATSVIYIAPVYSNDTPEEIVTKYPFWGEWSGNLPNGTLPALIINLGLTAFGVALALRGNRIAWYPLLFFLVYQMGNAIARTSGWRFSLPVDWIPLAYYCIALSYLPSLLQRPNRPHLADQTPAERSSRFFPILFLILFLAGMALPLTERLMPKKDLVPVTESAIQVLAQQGVVTRDELTAFQNQKNAVITTGVALYPRFFRPNGNIYLADMPEDFKYLHFWLINDGNLQVVLPREKPPEFFPHASIITVLGCQTGNFITARAVVIQHEGGEAIVFQDPLPALECP